mgnify:FL=1
MDDSVKDVNITIDWWLIAWNFEFDLNLPQICRAV